jgi:hypothetical protein
MTTTRSLRVWVAVLAVAAACNKDRPSANQDAGTDAPIVAPMGPPILPTCGRGGTCDLIAQDCGPEQSCVLDEHGAALCVARGVAGDGQDCAGNDQCQPGLNCDLDATNTGRCRRLCCPSATGGCSIETSCVGLEMADVGLCLPGAQCRPPDLGCEPGEACYIVGGRGTVACLPVGSGARGSACDRVNACDPGLACLRAAGAAAACVAMCDPFTSDGCADGETCGALPSGRAAVCE